MIQQEKSKLIKTLHLVTHKEMLKEKGLPLHKNKAKFANETTQSLEAPTNLIAIKCFLPSLNFKILMTQYLIS